MTTIEAESVLHSSLYNKCRAVLNNVETTIEVQPIVYAPPNDAEAALGQTLLVEVRMAMLGASTRHLHFSGVRPEVVKEVAKATKAEVAALLIEEGHVMQSVADTLGVSVQTLRNWGVSGGDTGKPESPDMNDEEAYKAGIACLLAKAPKAVRATLTDKKGNVKVDDLRKLVLDYKGQVLNADRFRRRAIQAGLAQRTLIRLNLEFAEAAEE